MNEPDDSEMERFFIVRAAHQSAALLIILGLSVAIWVYGGA